MVGLTGLRVQFTGGHQLELGLEDSKQLVNAIADQIPSSTPDGGAAA